MMKIMKNLGQNKNNMRKKIINGKKMNYIFKET